MPAPVILSLKARAAHHKPDGTACGQLMGTFPERSFLCRSRPAIDDFPELRCCRSRQPSARERTNRSSMRQLARASRCRAGAEAAPDGNRSCGSQPANIRVIYRRHLLWQTSGINHHDIAQFQTRIEPLTDPTISVGSHVLNHGTSNAMHAAVSRPTIHITRHCPRSAATPAIAAGTQSSQPGRPVMQPPGAAHCTNL